MSGVLLLLLLWPCPSAVAEWRVFKYADIENGDQDTLRFYRKWNESIFVMIILKPAIPGVFANRLPLYRIDSNPLHDLKLYGKVRTNKDSWVKWEIDNGQGPAKENLTEFIKGKIAVFQYYKPDGEICETVFSLDKADEAISELLK